MSREAVHAYGIICAKSEELARVRDIFKTEFPIIARGSRPEMPVHVVKSNDDAGPVTVFATCCTEMGHVHAASKTAQMVARYTPELVLFVGTAASLNAREIRLGDVVIPQSAIFRIYDKIIQKGSSSFAAITGEAGFKEHFFGDTALLADVMVEKLSDEAHTIVSGYTPSVTLRDGDLSAFWKDQLKKPRAPTVELDTDIFTCGMVVDSEHYKEFIRSRVGRKAYTIDMESFGFFQAINQLKAGNRVTDGTEGIMIRGISDYGGRKEETEIGGNWKTIAMENAALVACDFIKQHVAQKQR